MKVVDRWEPFTLLSLDVDFERDQILLLEVGLARLIVSVIF